MFVDRRENIFELGKTVPARPISPSVWRRTRHELLTSDELSFVPLSEAGAELLFGLISRRYKRGATIISSNLLFDEMMAKFDEERLTGALLDRLAHYTHILGMNGQFHCLAQS